MAEQLNWDFIPRSQVLGAVEEILLLREFFADESCPKCLVPVRLGEDALSSPVECREDSSRNSHSIQESGPLRDISSRGKGGRVVLRFFPDLGTVLNLTKGEDRVLGHKWLWEIEDVPPQCVPISSASIGHFACGFHDRDSKTLGKADNLYVPDLGGRDTLDDRDLPDGLNHFAESLFFLAYRTLIFRIGQLRGAERAAANVLDTQIDKGTRFAVSGTLATLKELSSLQLELYRFKSAFDRRILGDPSAIHLVHHLRQFDPIIRYASSDYIPVEFRSGRRKHYEWLSINVLPLQGQTWLFVSHIYRRNPLVIDIQKKVAAWASSNHLQRSHVDLGTFCRSPNLYACPEEFYGLPLADQSFVSNSMVKALVSDNLGKDLDLLRSSPAGGPLVSRIERGLRESFQRWGS